PITSPLAATLSASVLRSLSDESMSTCGAKRNKSTPSNFVPFTSAAAVRLSIVSRSMNGSPPSEPLPTTPGQAALWSLGKLLPFDAELIRGLSRCLENPKSESQNPNDECLINDEARMTKFAERQSPFGFRH